MDDDVQQALAFLRKHDVKHTGARELVEVDLDALDLADGRPVSHEPVGPNWKRPSNNSMLPKIAGHPDTAWLMNERQDKTGKYKPWIFFSKITGKYFRVNDSGNGYESMSRPHNPWASPICVRVGSSSMLFSGSKLDMTVLLPDLQKTGFLLKQPLDFMDRPASLFVLCAGLRGTVSAAEFCAKRIHTLLLPKLSSRATVWYDYELVDALTETAKAMDDMLLESPACFAGCSLAVALLSGGRLLVASIGNVRCLLCRPSAPAAASARGQAAALERWTARRIAGTNEHAVPDAEGAGGTRYGSSASLASLVAVEDEWEREFLRVTRATNSFAALGISASDIEGGSAAIRKIFRRRSLLVHPDKVSEQRRKDSTAMFSKLEAAADAVEACFQEDAAAAKLLAEIHGACDEGRVAAEPVAAAQLLGVKEGSDKKSIDAAAKKKFEDKLARLQAVARLDVERAMKIIESAKESVLRGTRLWTPQDRDAGVRATQALGCKDLKAPDALLGASLATEVVKLGVGEAVGLALVTEGAESVTDASIAQRLGEHSPGRPRAAALRVALDAKKGAESQVACGGATSSVSSCRGRRRREALSVVCAFLSSNHESSGSGAPPPAKRARSGELSLGPGLPPPAERVRVSHVLLRWAGLKGEDEFERPGMPPPERSQADAERELLELLEELLAPRDPKTLGARFKVAVLKRSECTTALNVPHADVGWIEPGGADPTILLAAFDTPVGGLSDVVVTARGAHLMYRLG